MEWIVDPTIWAGLATLIVLEIVLGIDNLVFIAILADKLPAKLRDKARLTGLSCALVMRIVLLFSLSWLITLTQPLITLFDHPFSARDLIMLVGGIFLLFKATMELNERLEGKDHDEGKQRKTTSFWSVVAQIIVLDAVFSLDSVITAVGMVDHLGIMVAAVTIAMILMIIASKPLTSFVNNHPTIVILCLSFLLMIGFSLVAEGFGYAIPKGYLYAAIGFSIMIESLNQLAMFNRRRFLTASRSMRERTAEAVLRIISGKPESSELDAHTSDLVSKEEVFDPQERQMIVRVLGLSQRNVNSIMTSRHDVEYVDINSSKDELRELLEKDPHSRLVITDGEHNDEPVGVVNIIQLLNQQLRNEPLNLRLLIAQPLIFPEGLSLLHALEQFRSAHTHFAFVVDEFGSVEGIVTLTDVMETIAGNLPVSSQENDSRHDIVQNEDGSWTVNGFTPLEDLILYIPMKLDDKREYETLAGLLMEHLQRVPTVGEKIMIDGIEFEPLDVNNHRINKVRIVEPIIENDEENVDEA
ncbi:TerC family protein [Proteus myxofaciens]|uniref:Putative capsular polysaccharide transport protein n=1 Tax=Proteus myxofaciens ATCC 19692 TaxID=1354337 RepID=A0A198FFX2_9GAMM|nr:TerC family protein [Proteus myxofaciens]OAT23778.1 putative capsular polysaccharide transport protein [Proteus myxofaciens ATCC 19692]